MASGLADKLQKIAAQRAVKARVGILEDKTYPDGPAVAQVGYWNEYGYEGIVVPERTGTVYHSVNEKTGEMNAGGKFVKKSKANLAREVVIKEHNISIPPRPFFRKTIADNRKLLPSMAAKLLKKHDPETVMRILCDYLVDQLENTVQTWTDPPNAKSTIRQKGYDSPLRGPDRLLRNSFSYEINPDD